MDLIITVTGRRGALGRASLALRLGPGRRRGGEARGRRRHPGGALSLPPAALPARSPGPAPTGLALLPLAPSDGWCDEPGDPLYNRPVTLPYKARHEVLWRRDDIYDLIVVLGHNDDPVRPGAGSAVFLHVARPDFSPTAGCIVLAKHDLLALLAEASPGDGIDVRL